MDSVTHIPCSRCKQSLPTSMFHKNRRENRGFSWYCKPCKKEHEQDRRADPEYSAKKKHQFSVWVAKNKRKKQFLDQRANAKKRGIHFEFTYRQWLRWWGSDLKHRGCAWNRLVMARFGDTGPYHPANCYKASPLENQQDRQ